MTARGLILSLSLLFFSGSPVFPFSNDTSSLDFFKSLSIEIEEELAEDSFEFSIGNIAFSKAKLFVKDELFPDKKHALLSSFKSRQDLHYYKCSKTILPSLNIQVIIFPFHIFL